MWLVILIVVLLIGMVGALIASCIWYPRYNPRAEAGRFPAVHRPEDCDAIATDLLKQMSVKEKLAQLSGDLSPSRFSLLYVLSWRLGSGIPLIFSGRNRRLHIPPLAFSDGPRGVNVGRNRTCFPVTMARGATFDPDLEEAVGRAMGRELRAIGANYSGAVCVNLLRHPGWGRAQETYGEDPFHLGEMGVALTRGLQSQNVMACVKHFALNSIENSRFYVDVQVDERSLREVYLPHFKKIVQRGDVASVMSAYNRFRGQYCGHSHDLLTRILREEWGFKGFVTSDWLHGVRDGVAGFKAGMDVEMPATSRYGRPLTRALRAGTITEEDLDVRVHRILRTRLWYALAPDTEPVDESVIACAEHVALARRVAAESMVLLKNEGILPLQPESDQRIGLFGRLADMENTGDTASSAVVPPHVITPLQGLREQAAAVGAVVEYHDGADVESAAGQVDVAVVVVGLTHHDEGEWFVMNPDKKADAWRPPYFGEGGDRQRLSLRPEDADLIGRVVAVQSRTVVVCVGGSAITMPWRESVAGIVFAFYSGMEGGHALASLLFGQVNPSGKLPFSIPERPADLPPFDPTADIARYGSLHGYTLLDTNQCPVAFPFGHGLSYTEFHLRDLVVNTEDEDWIATVTLTNQGAVAGAEVVQAYLHTAESGEPRKLAAFEKVWLEPAGTARVVLTLEAQTRARFDPETMTWGMSAVPFTIHVGTSSRNLTLQTTIHPPTH